MAATLYLRATRVRLELFSFDEEYLRRLRTGDSLAEWHFATYFSEMLLIKLRARRLQPADIEDARQETITRALVAVRTEGTLRQPERLGPFVNSICNNVLLELDRKKKRTPTADEDIPEVQDSTPDPEQELVSKETCELVRKILKSMPDKDARVLRAVFLEEKDREEVCREFDVGREYIRVLLHRAKERFKIVYAKRQVAVKKQVIAHEGE
jgi:RNA polymerase sigma-70 factor, ECF subfamily